MMVDLIEELCGRLDLPELLGSDVIPWACPIPFFGNPETSEIATLALNPSNREFVDLSGVELKGASRRFPTLSSLRIGRWSWASAAHHQLVYEACTNYFSRAPYDSWFKPLDYLISGNAASYYFPSHRACHLDLVAYATYSKWSDLSAQQRDTLLTSSAPTLGFVLRRTGITSIIVNGTAVMNALASVSDLKFSTQERFEWDMPQKHGRVVKGVAYFGSIEHVGSIELGRPIRVLGYNLNLQSSFGVSTDIRTNLRTWITQRLNSD